MHLRSIHIFAAATALLVGLFLLPASTFTILSPFLVLSLPSIGLSKHYTRLTRAVAALLIISAVFLSSWLVALVSDGGRPMTQALPWLADACVEARQALSFLFSVSLSPACRLIVLGPMQEFGSGFFIELFLLINLIWIRVSNYQDQTSWNTSETGWGNIALFVFQALLMGLLARSQDMAMSTEPIEPPDSVVLSIFFILGATMMYAWATLQGMLFTPRRPSRGFRRGIS